MGREVEQLVEDEGSAVRELDETHALAGGAGEGAALVAEELGGDRVEIVAAAKRGADDGALRAGLGDGLGEERLAGAGLAEDEDGELGADRRRDLVAEAADPFEREDVLERRRAPRVGRVRERLAEARAVALAARALIEERADEERGRHEEVDVGLLDVLPRIADVDIEDGACGPGLRAGSMKRCSERREDPEGVDARRGAERVDVPGRALAGVERAMDEGLADLLALERVEVLALGAPVNRTRRARLVDGEDEPAVGTNELDEDVEAIVEHGVALEHAEDALEEEAHGAPHRLRVGGGAVREAVGHRDNVSH